MLRRAVVVCAAVAALLGLARLGGSILRCKARTAFTDELGVPAAASCQRPGGAAEYLRAGALGMVLSGEEKSTSFELVATGGRRWSAAQREQARALLADRGAALELLHRAVGKPHYGFGVRDDAPDVRFGIPLFAFMDAFRVLGVEARLAWLDGGERRAELALSTMATLASALEREDLLTVQVTGLAGEAWLLAAVAERVAAGPIASGSLAAAMREMVPHVDVREAWRRMLRESVVAGAWGGEDATGGARLLAVPLAPLWEARRQRAAVRLAAELDGPPGKAEMGSELGWAWWDPAGAFETHLARTSNRYRAAMAARRLARAALALVAAAGADGRYPVALPPTPGDAAGDPFTGDSLELTALAGGGVEVAVPTGPAVWRRLFPEVSAEPPFAWRLPPPSQQ